MFLKQCRRIGVTLVEIGDLRAHLTPKQPKVAAEASKKPGKDEFDPDFGVPVADYMP